MKYTAMHEIIIPDVSQKYLNEIALKIDTYYSTKFEIFELESSNDYLIRIECDADTFKSLKNSTLTMADGKNIQMIDNNEAGISLQSYSHVSIPQTNSKDETHKNPDKKKENEDKLMSIGTISPIESLKSDRGLEATNVNPITINTCETVKVPVKNKSILTYLMKSKLPDIEKIRNDLVEIEEYRKEEDNEYAIELRATGPQRDINEPKRKIEELIKMVHCVDKDISCKEQVKHFDLIVSGLESKHQCKIDYKVNRNQNYDDTVKEKIMINETEVSIIKAPIEDQDVNIIVNSVQKNFNLSKGMVSKCLLDKAGPELQTDCTNLIKIDYGEVKETSSYKLKCNKIYHCLGLKWKENESQKVIQVLENIIKNCLKKANGDKFQSIALPPFCCGYLKMPRDTSASTILKTVKTFLQENPNTSIKCIKIVIHGDEYDAILNSFVSKLKEINPNSAISQKSYVYNVLITHIDQTKIDEVCEELSSIIV